MRDSRLGLELNGGLHYCLVAWLEDGDDGDDGEDAAANGTGTGTSNEDLL